MSLVDTPYADFFPSDFTVKDKADARQSKVFRRGYSHQFAVCSLKDGLKEKLEGKIGESTVNELLFMVRFCLSLQRAMTSESKTL